MKRFLLGQRWVSESEPELGLGLVVEAQDKTVQVAFPAAGVDRRYGIQSAPLRRIRFQEGDEIKLRDGGVHTVLEVGEKDGIVHYRVEGAIHAETLLADTLALARPEERLFAGSVDSNEMFKLRYDVLLNQRKQLASPVRGFTGGRIALIPHQFHVAGEVARRARPRVMLADEVGLGKTVEAGLILHHLLLTGRASKVLILVPDSLVYQWFVEMLKKFGLSFATINHESKLEEGDDPFADGQLFVASLRYVMQTEWLHGPVLNADWDMLVVDEAHQMRWSPDGASPEYVLVEHIAKKTEGLVLLSGTPEILGLAGHFARLRLLDPQRFHDYGSFLEEHAGYQEISSIAKFLQGDKPLSERQRKKLALLGLDAPADPETRSRVLSELLDRHGTGRVYFRNTRARMAEFAEFFPKRLLHPAPLPAAKGKDAERKDYNAKVDWLVTHLARTKDQKTLLLCHDKDLVVMLEASLKAKSPAKVAAFHAGMPLLVRDRAAAWFADPEGAQLLLSTEVGSEGRNFEFSQHLVMFDLPKLPDLLEQRIGRLDRIGQKNDINIHVPYTTGGKEEVLFRWYDEGLRAFTTSPRGASELYATVRVDLLAVLHATEEKGIPEQKLTALIERTREEHARIEEKLEEGQDRLVELNSYDAAAAGKFMAELRAVEESPDLKDFMLALFERLGVDAEDLDGDVFHVRPGDNMYLPHFPHLPHEGLGVTFKRSTALRKPEVTFLTWDHPMVTGIMELVQSKEMGNVTLASWRMKAKEPFLFEGFYLLQCVAPKGLGAEKWFPPTPVRVLLNNKFQDLTPKFPKKALDADVGDAAPERKAQLKELPREFMKECLKRGKEAAVPRAREYKEKFLAQMREDMGREIARLKKLREVNPTVSPEEIAKLEDNRARLEAAMGEAQLVLDSFRLVM